MKSFKKGDRAKFRGCSGQSTGQGTHRMTPREQLLAEAADLEAAAAQKRQSAAALDAEPDWVEELARKCCAECYERKGRIYVAKRYLSGEYKMQDDIELQIAVSAIRAALSRVPVAAWPGEAEIAQIAAQVTAFGTTPYEAAFAMARRLRAHMTAGGKPEGGEA